MSTDAAHLFEPLPQGLPGTVEADRRIVGGDAQLCRHAIDPGLP